MSGPRAVRAPRGSVLSCKGWPQEAALRMLHNNLDPEVAERPDDLIVYGGTGKAARSWSAFDRIVDSLRRLDGTRPSSCNRGNPSGSSGPAPRTAPAYLRGLAPLSSSGIGVKDHRPKTRPVALMSRAV